MITLYSVRRPSLNLLDHDIITYVETSKLGAIAVEGRVVELDELGF